MRSTKRSRIGTLFLTLSLGYCLFLIALTLLHLLAPQRNGLLAFSQVFAPYLFVPLLLFLPMAVRSGPLALRLALLVCVVVFVVRFVPWPIFMPGRAAPTGPVVRAMSLNARVGGDPKRMRPLLLTRPAEVVALLETDGTWIEGDEELRRLYPYQLIRKGEPTAGMVLLSVYPILEQPPPEQLEAGLFPLRLLWARLDLGQGQTLRLVAFHPPPPRILGEGLLAAGYHTDERDAAVREFRDFINPVLQSGEHVLTIGDFNTTNREPGYKDLSAGFVDARAALGGIGLTWRPESLREAPVPMLRIDYHFSSPNVAPLETSVDCTPRGSDHCVVLSKFEIK